MSAICAMVPTTMNRKGPAPMKTIVVSLLKGGVGKTFLATHLAWYLSEQGGNRVAFLDLDPQGSSTRRLASERTGWFSADLFDPEARLDLTDGPGITVFAADSRLQMVRAAADVRSEARRVGKECVSTCRSRGSPYQ